MKLDIVNLSQKAWEETGRGWAVKEWYVESEPSFSQFATLIVEACAEVCEKSDRYRGDYFAAKIRELIGGKDVDT